MRAKSKQAGPVQPAAGPIEPKRRKRRSQEPPKYLTIEQLDAFFKVVKDARDRCIFELMYHRGLRASEVGRLQLDDYRERSQRLYVHRLKGSFSGEFGLTDRELKALRAWLRVRGKVPGPLFPGYKGRGLSRYMLDDLVKQYGKAAGLPADVCHCHVFKHSCATSLFEAGADLREVQDHIGHANIQNTVIYTRVTNKRRDQLAEKMRGAW